MEKPKPLTAREKKVLAMVLEESLPPSVVAERIRATPNAIRIMLCRLRLYRGIDVPVAGNSNRRTVRSVRLSARVMRRLAIIASRNNVSSGQVARWIFAAIDRENLFEELMERGRGRAKP